MSERTAESVRFEAEYWRAVNSELRTILGDIAVAARATADEAVCLAEIALYQPLRPELQRPVEEALAAGTVTLERLKSIQERILAVGELMDGRLVALQEEADLPQFEETTVNHIVCRLPFGPSAVTIDGVPAPFEESIKIRNHSPTGLAWGYGGSGPAQTALAILLVVNGTAGSEENGFAGGDAERFYQAFKFEHVARWPQTDHEVDIDVAAWLAEKKGDTA